MNRSHSIRSQRSLALLACFCIVAALIDFPILASDDNLDEFVPEVSISITDDETDSDADWILEASLLQPIPLVLPSLEEQPRAALPLPHQYHLTFPRRAVVNFCFLLAAALEASSLARTRLVVE